MILKQNEGVWPLAAGHPRHSVILNRSLDDRSEILLAPLAILLRHSVRIPNGIVTLILADDPTLVITKCQPLGDLVKVKLTGPHLRPRLGAISTEVLIMDMIHEVLPLVHGVNDVHLASDDVANIRCPTSRARI